MVKRCGKQRTQNSATVRSDEKTLTNKIDVSHELFIRNWPQFGKWLRNELEKSKVYDELIRSVKNDKPKGARIDNRALSQIEDILNVKHCSYEWAQRYNDIIKKYYWNDITEKKCSEIYHEACEYYNDSLNSQKREVEEEKQKIERMARLKEKAERKEKEIEEQKERHRLAMKAEKLQSEIALQKENKRKLIFGTSTAIAIVLLAVSLWTFNVSRDQARLENERTRIESEWAKREATAFQPYAVASAIKGPVSLLPPDLQIERLWEAAVALRALDMLEEDPFVEGNRDLSLRHLRLERASRLAHELSNHAIREIMRSVPWKLNDTQEGSQSSNTSDPTRSVELGPKRETESMRFRSLSKKDELYGCWLRINNLALAKQKGQSGGESGSEGSNQQTDVSAYENLLVAGGADPLRGPSKGILYNKDRGLLAFATVSESANACQTTQTMQIPPQAEVFADPSLRLFAHVSGASPSRSQPNFTAASVYRSFLYRLRWYSNCRQIEGAPPSDGCEREWKVDPDSLGYLEFNVAPEFEFRACRRVFRGPRQGCRYGVGPV